MIQAVRLSDGTGRSQTQNVGDGYFYGFEVSAETDLSPQLAVGGNYTFIHRTITDPSTPGFEPTGVPSHKAFIYASWRPLERLTVTPSLEITSDRWSDVNIGTNAANQAIRNVFPNGGYIRTGAYTLANINVSYKVTENLEVAGGVKNMLDQNYELAWGLPSPGRTFYAKARATF